MPGTPFLKNDVSCVAGKTGHLQGIAADVKNGYLYWSFTTLLIKTDLNGKIIGSVKGLIGHLGCIAFCEKTGKLWGTLELKHDAVGQGISRLIGRDMANEDAFYAVVFDCDQITAENMDAETDGVMKAAYLPEVVDDYAAVLPDGKQHRYGCSGIDGITFAPAVSTEENAPMRLYIAYGIYGDVNRNDNDDQVILCLDPEETELKAKALNQYAPHKSGVSCVEKIFLPTGNTTYGIQNLEYDSYSDSFFAAVYPGKKTCFSNPPMFVFPRAQKPVNEDGKNVRLNAEIKELFFPLGSTGIFSLGNREFLVSEPMQKEGKDAGTIKTWLYTGIPPEGFEPAK
ncbi:MAG: hypothetical protein IKZ19_06485 [Clostridia bacterium]|nr:hypothetical protein [Clostridia bacterium]